MDSKLKIGLLEAEIDELNQHLNETRSAYFTLLAENNKLKENNDHLISSNGIIEGVLSLERQENFTLRQAIDQIDTHIRSTSDPIPNIIQTLKELLEEENQ